MPAKKDAQWWKDYRANKKTEETVNEPVEPGVVDAGLMRDRVRKVGKIVRPDAPISETTGGSVPSGSGYRMLPDDHWVTKLTQHQRDAILNHPAIKTARRDK